MTQRSFNKNEEIELCREARKGSGESIDLLIEKHLPLVRSIVNRYSGSNVEPDDLLQEGLIGLMFAVRSYRGEQGAAFSTFAHKCITNRVLSALSSAGKFPKEIAVHELPLSDEEADPQDLIVTKERVQRWKESIREKLSPLERETVYLYLFGYPVRDIAVRLGISAKSVDNALQRAKRKMRCE